MTGISACKLTTALNSNREIFAKLISKYFSKNYTGSHFEFFDGRGDKGKTKNKFTYADMFAPNFLGVKVPAELAFRLVEGDLAKKASEALKQIPAKKPLHEFDTNPLNEEPSQTLWKIVLDGKGGVVRTSKLLARKRPHLFPVLDSVLQDALGQGKSGRWDHYFTLFSDEKLLKELAELQKDAAELEPAFSDIANLSLLRVLDIALWMEHRNAISTKDDVKKQHSEDCLLK